MLLNHNLRPEKVHSKATPAQNPVPATSATRSLAATATLAPPVVPFARLPHSLLADTRLSPTDRLIAAALLFWACDRTTATMANNSIGKLLGLSLSVVERGMRALKQLGYVTADVVKPSPSNMTGRVVRLAWVENPTLLPPVPDRRSIEAGGSPSAPQSSRGAVAGEGASVEQGPSMGKGAPVAGDGEGPSGATVLPPSRETDKEDRVVKKPENPKNAGTKGEPGERQRPQAASKPASQVVSARPAISTTLPIEPPPLASTLNRALLGVCQAALVVGVLTEGQRIALASMTTAERAAFEGKSPGMRAQILGAFTHAFEPTVFDRITRPMLVVPRFVAEAKPVDRSTPGLVRAVAGGDPRLVADLAEALCRDLGGAGDRRRWGALHALAGQILRQEVGAEAVLDALRQAKGPKAENPGAVFTYALKSHGWRP